MKKALFAIFSLCIFLGTASAQMKKDGTPDMRYKANKEQYGNTTSNSDYSTPSYSQPKTKTNKIL